MPAFVCISVPLPSFCVEMTFLNVDGFVRHVTQKTLTHMEITIVFDRHGLEILFWFKIIFYF